MLVERLPLVARGLRPDGTDEPALELELQQGSDGTAAIVATSIASEPIEAGVRVELRLERTDDPQWLVPGVFYGENRPQGAKRRYPRFVPGRADREAMESDAWSF